MDQFHITFLLTLTLCCVLLLQRKQSEGFYKYYKSNQRVRIKRGQMKSKELPENTEGLWDWTMLEKQL